jgi:CRP-like cAMP-binding protein
MATFLNSVSALCPRVTKAELEYLQSGLTVTELKSKHFYIHANTIQKEIGFVFSGLLRAFYIDKDGNEISVSFTSEGKYATHYAAFITQTPSKYYFQCIEPSILINLPYAHIQEGYNKFPNLERYGRLISEEVLKMQQKRIESFLFENAEIRYLEFVKENPDLFNRVSLSHLASSRNRKTISNSYPKKADTKPSLTHLCQLLAANQSEFCVEQKSMQK